jgi:hypothetical protein
MANTLLGQTQYTYGTLQAQNSQYTTLAPQWGTTTQPYYYMYPSLTEAEKAGKAIAILKELHTDGLVNIDSVEKFCELIDRIASKI